MPGSSLTPRFPFGYGPLLHRFAFSDLRISQVSVRSLQPNGETGPPVAIARPGHQHRPSGRIRGREHAGDASPAGMQRLMSRACWDAEAGQDP